MNHQESPSPSGVCRPLIVGIAVALSAAFPAIGAEARYVARFADGSRLEGNNLANWHDDNAQPQLEGRTLFDPGNPLRWLRDRKLTPGAEPTAFVELITGDCLPGSVVGFAATGEEYDPLPSHFIVQPSITLRPQAEAALSTVRVIASHVRRIVWQRKSNVRLQPSSLLLLDGRQLTYRAIRFDSEFVSVLLAEGNKRIPYSDLAEAHLPPSNYWKRYLEELAILSPQGTTRLVQVETTEGLVATGSKDRSAIYSRSGNAQETQHWVHGMQPAWSLDILWVPNDRIWLRRSFSPFEVPLSRVPPASAVHRSSLGKLAEPWQRDRNLAGEPLRSGTREWGFGFACTTTLELAFDLPPGAKSVRGSLGLDRLAGKGGCAEGVIATGAAGDNKLWESPLLQGSDQVIDFGPLSLPTMAESQKLYLRADAAHRNRPAGADPLEVRDFVDWLDPVVEFEPNVWLPAIRKLIPSTIPAWSQWQVSQFASAPEKSAKIQAFNKFAASPGRFRTGLVLEQPLVVTRKLSLSPTDRWLAIHLSRPLNQGNEPRLEVHLAGELVGEFKVPVNGGGYLSPMVVPLLGYHGSAVKEVDVQLTLFADPGVGPLEWQRCGWSTSGPPCTEFLKMKAGSPALLVPRRSWKRAMANLEPLRCAWLVGRLSASPSTGRCPFARRRLGVNIKIGISPYEKKARGTCSLNSRARRSRPHAYIAIWATGRRPVGTRQGARWRPA